MVSANYAGVGSSFLLGALWIRRFDQLQLLIIIEALVGTFLMLSSFLYFPSSPPTPPSVSCAARHDAVVDNTSLIWRNPSFWRVCLSFGLVTGQYQLQFCIASPDNDVIPGVYSGWGGVLTLNLEAINISQEQAGWVGFAGVSSGLLGGIVGSALVDNSKLSLQVFRKPPS